MQNAECRMQNCGFKSRCLCQLKSKCHSELAPNYIYNYPQFCILYFAFCIKKSSTLNFQLLKKPLYSLQFFPHAHVFHTEQ
jgi:hypothetical protein